MLRFRLFAFGVALAWAGASAGAQTTPATATPAPDSVKVVDIVGKPDSDLGKILKANIATALAAGRTPVVELGATWCGPCHDLANSLGDERMRDAFAGVYLIRLDIDQWKDKLEPFGLKVTGIPAFFPVDDTGKALGPTIDGGAWGENIPENMAPPLKKFFSENLRKKTTVEKKA